MVSACHACAAPLARGATTCRRCGSAALRAPALRVTEPGTGGSGTRLWITPSGGPRPPMRLLHLLPEGGVETVSLPETLVIGRHQGDLRLEDDPFVSSRHARVRWDGSNYVLEDLGSRNGTYFRVVGETQITQGDHVLLGVQVFRFEESGSAPSKAKDAAAKSRRGRGGDRVPMGETRLVAVWFADIVGFTPMSSADEERALTMLHRFQRACTEVVEGFGGRIVKFLGDATLAEFQSAAVAVRAALGVLRAFEGTAPLRVGVHLGDVVAAPDGDIYGDSVNVASRVHSAAEPGGVVVSEDVHRQLRRRAEFTFENLGPRELKGVSEPVTLYTVLRSTEREDEPEAPAITARGDASDASTMLLGAAPASGPRLVRITQDGATQETYVLRTGTTTIGRTNGDITFPEDKLLSAAHASIARTAGQGGGPARFTLRDEGSRNGVYLRLREPRRLTGGDIFVVGRQLFRLDPEAEG